MKLVTDYFKRSFFWPSLIITLKVISWSIEIGDPALFKVQVDNVHVNGAQSHAGPVDIGGLYVNLIDVLSMGKGDAKQKEKEEPVHFASL